MTTKDKISEYQKQYRLDNKEKIAEYKKQYRLDNKEKIAEGNKQYRQRNRDKINRQKKQYYQKHKEKFATYKHISKLLYCETVRKDLNNSKLGQVKCKYCGKWYNPLSVDISHRINALNNMKIRGIYNLYCSDNCKIACPIYLQSKYPKDFKPSTSREVQPELRQMVLLRDNYTCQKCGAIDTELHCHHITGIVQNPIESADIDNCITFCKKCHKFVHTLPDCSYYELRC